MKTEYKGIMFDSELEVEYFKLLESEYEDTKINHWYNNQRYGHLKPFKKKPIPINIDSRKNYTPDFVLWNNSMLEFTIVECKGYDRWNGNTDAKIAALMKSWVEETPQKLLRWLEEIFELEPFALANANVKFKKVKRLAKYGFVDFSFKAPTLAQRRKEKIIELEEKIDVLEKKVKEYEKYFYLKSKKGKLSPKQTEFMKEFCEKMGIK